MFCFGLAGMGGGVGKPGLGCIVGLIGPRRRRTGASSYERVVHNGVLGFSVFSHGCFCFGFGGTVGGFSFDGTSFPEKQFS